MAAEQVTDEAPRGADAPAVPEAMFEGVGCVLTLREPWHKSGNRELKIAATAAQVRDRLRRGEFAKFDRLSTYSYAEFDSPTSWKGHTVSHEIHIRSSEVVLIDERIFGASVGVNFRFEAMANAEYLLDPCFPKTPWWKFWA